MLLFQLFFLLLLLGNTPFWTGVQWSLWHTCFLKSVTGLCMVSASPQKGESCFYLAGFCSGCFVHSGLQSLATFSEVTEPVPFCGRAGCCRAARHWGTDNVRNLGLLRNAVCTIAAIGAYWHSLLCVPSDQSALCVITRSIFIFQVGVATPQFHSHAHALVLVLPTPKCLLHHCEDVALPPRHLPLGHWQAAVCSPEAFSFPGWTSLVPLAFRHLYKKEFKW